MVNQMEFCQYKTIEMIFYVVEVASIAVYLSESKLYK